MSISLDLPDELVAALKGEAAQLGMTLPDYATRILASEHRRAASVRSGLELVAYWRNAGVLGSRPEIEDGQAYARQLRDQAQTRDVIR